MRNEDYWKAGIRSLFFFSPFLNACFPSLQGWNSFGEVVGKRMKRALFRGKWSMVFGNECTFSREYREEMVYCGLYLKWSHAMRHCWRGEHAARESSRTPSRAPRTISIDRCIVSGYVSSSFPFFLSFFFSPPFLLASTGWRIEQDVLVESRPEMIRLKYSLKFQFSRIYVSG